uniref:Uncharacterized protein n=1 Tax=Myoviridae sp. ctq9w2 TaxID=2825177 RepID=A0A8S5PYD8_9CAUD|nr:MAG TPA: hypothetical protein [Myoviridae sp. ctq9w2]
MYRKTGSMSRVFIFSPFRWIHRNGENITI